MYVRSMPAVQFWLGNDPGCDGWLDARSQDRQPYFDQHERRLVLSLGEPAYNDLCQSRFEQQYRDDPRGFWIKCIWRGMYMLISEPAHPAKYPLLANIRWQGMIIDKLAINIMVAVLGLAGMWAAWRLRFRCHWLPLVAAATTAPYVPTGVLDRYTLPLRLVLVFYMGLLLWAVTVRIRQGSWHTVR
jgi:hypothetical protein